MNNSDAVTIFTKESPSPTNSEHRLSPQESLKILGNIQIPPQPEIVRALMTERASDNPDTQKIAELIGRDTGLTAAVLKTVNSPYFGLRNKIHSIQQAISMLGMKNVGALVLGLALRTSIPVKGMDHYWESTSRAAQISFMLARHLGLRNAEEVQLYVLFHDSGMPVLLQRFPDYLETVRQIPNTSWTSITALEELHHKTNHAVVGWLFANTWGLSDGIREAILRHHDPIIFEDNAVSAESRTLIALGHIAEHIEETLSQQLNECSWEEFGLASLKHLMMGEAELNDFIEIAKDQLRAEIG
jgi:HD-like signal output (HDOD) protein